MKRIKVFLAILGLVLSLFTVVACQEKTVVLSKEELEALVFESATFEYDGNPHNIYVQDVPKGVTVTYMSKDLVDPGTYIIIAIVESNGVKVTKHATLTINQKASLLEAETEQTTYLYGGNPFPVYSLNNDEQEMVYIIYQDGVKVDESALFEVGDFTVEMYAAKSVVYSESNHITVNLSVVESDFGVSFESSTIEVDGNEHELLISGTLPEGYTVTYTNNKATSAGTYYAKAEIKDSSNNVVETHAAVLKMENPKNLEFEEYLDDFFVKFLEEDQLSVNIFCENPEDFGLLHYDASWYTYESFTDEDVEEAKTEFADLKAELEVFKDAKLSDLQIVAYNRIEAFLDYYIEYYNIEDTLFMSVLYVDSFGGYVADFGTYMEAYSLRSEQEVKDVVSYIQSTKDAFPSYLLFVNDKAEAGYPLSDYTINEMRKYIKDILDDEDYYLTAILKEKINALSFLTEEQKTSYCSQLDDAVANYFLPGLTSLYDGLAAYKGKLDSTSEGYWATYENGQTLYKLELEDLLGINDLDTAAFISEVDAALKESVDLVVDTQGDLVDKLNVSTYDQLEAAMARYPIFDGTPEEMIDYLKEFAKTIVPDLQTSPDIVIKNMDDASAKVSNAVAYYMKSALDNSSSEFITLNPLKLGDKNDVLGTMAHEGYPGHLYAYVYSKELGLHNISKIMTSTAHGEGWATYVELKLYEYAKSKSSNTIFNMIMDYLYANQLSGFLLETRIDLGIHLEGWTTKDVQKLMKQLGYVSDEETAKDIYRLLIEMPTGYAAYGYGKLTFCKLHDEAKDILGHFYDEVEFNAMLLSKGWTSLSQLQDTYDEYMTNKCHELGIEYK